MKTLLRLLASLGVNAVPAIGWFFEGWSSGTMLVIYWFENVAATVFIAGRILVHRRLVPCRGHFKHNVTQGNAQGPPGSFLSHFLTVSLAFSIFHGIFLAAILFLLTVNGKGGELGLDWHNVRIGAGSVLLFLTIGFLMDLPGMRKRPFFWIERIAEGNLARVFIIHVTLIFGMLAVALTGATRAFFGVFVALKTMNDLNAVVPQWNPDEPPRWLCRIMDKIPNAAAEKGPGPRRDETFAEFWKRDKANEIARRTANEKPYDAD